MVILWTGQCFQSKIEFTILHLCIITPQWLTSLTMKKCIFWMVWGNITSIWTICILYSDYSISVLVFIIPRSAMGINLKMERTSQDFKYKLGNTTIQRPRMYWTFLSFSVNKESSLVSSTAVFVKNWNFPVHLTAKQAQEKKDICNMSWSYLCNMHIVKCPFVILDHFYTLEKLLVKMLRWSDVICE